MKIYEKILFALLMVFAFSFSVKAETCSYADKAKINKLATNVKGMYEETTKEELADLMYEGERIKYTTEFLVVKILNISEEIKLEVTSDDQSINRVYTYEDSVNGVISFDWKNLNSVHTITVKVMAADNYVCDTDTLRTFNIKLPRKNMFYSYGICEPASEYYMCQKYVTAADMSENDFFDNVNKFLDNKNKEKTQAEEEKNKSVITKILDFVNDNKITIIIVISVIIVGGVTIVVINKKRRSSEL